ncbi:unnamed protein product [Arctia plantaginis]|uniref:Down syndrome cell adhesion molecule-like protein Dscam2 n=1 Tax=Arctia plantaginis TaxID=874455 RepID=A0A8S1A602_ARCPL|nr:unnamed protein product [Arctia plantaginis]CAB3256157.1 unnamed protein product [Arctia plantaginis]
MEFEIQIAHYTYQAGRLSLCGGEGQEHGPVFLMEPPPRLVFSNTTGARVSCAAHGFPSPQIAWQQPDGGQLDDVPGLR